jgi:hypothetical protein
MIKKMVAAVAVIALGSSVALAESSKPRYQMKYIGPRNTPVLVRADRPAPSDQPKYAATSQDERKAKHRVLRFLGPRNSPVWTIEQG